MNLNKILSVVFWTTIVAFGTIWIIRTIFDGLSLIEPKVIFWYYITLMLALTLNRRFDIDRRGYQIFLTESLQREFAKPINDLKNHDDLDIVQSFQLFPDVLDALNFSKFIKHVKSGKFGLFDPDVKYLNISHSSKHEGHLVVSIKPMGYLVAGIFILSCVSATAGLMMTSVGVLSNATMVDILLGTWVMLLLSLGFCIYRAFMSPDIRHTRDMFDKYSQTSPVSKLIYWGFMAAKNFSNVGFSNTSTISRIAKVKTCILHELKTDSATLVDPRVHAVMSRLTPLFMKCQRKFLESGNLSTLTEIEKFLLTSFQFKQDETDNCTFVVIPGIKILIYDFSMYLSGSTIITEDAEIPHAKLYTKVPNIATLLAAIKEDFLPSDPHPVVKDDQAPTEAFMLPLTDDVLQSEEVSIIIAEASWSVIDLLSTSDGRSLVSRNTLLYRWEVAVDLKSAILTVRDDFGEKLLICHFDIKCFVNPDSIVDIEKFCLVPTKSDLNQYLPCVNDDKYRTRMGQLYWDGELVGSLLRVHQSEVPCDKDVYSAVLSDFLSINPPTVLDKLLLPNNCHLVVNRKADKPSEYSFRYEEQGLFITNPYTSENFYLARLNNNIRKISEYRKPIPKIDSIENFFARLSVSYKYRVERD